VDFCRFIYRLYCCFLAGVGYRTQDNNQAIKRSKYVFNKALRACKLNQAHNQGGGKPGICIRPKVFKHLLDFIEKLMLIFGFSESP